MPTLSILFTDNGQEYRIRHHSYSRSNASGVLEKRLYHALRPKWEPCGCYALDANSMITSTDHDAAIPDSLLAAIHGEVCACCDQINGYADFSGSTKHTVSNLIPA